jgi:alanine racemase
MIDWIRNLIKPKLKSMNHIKINSTILLENLEYLKSIQPHSSIIPILKSNAYWHWLKEICKILKNNSNIDLVWVDSFPEYQIAKKYTNKKILILWETIAHNYKYFNFKKASFIIYNINTLDSLSRFRSNINIHLFLNTWMNREWIDWSELESFLNKLKEYSNINLEWVCSHIADNNSTNIENQVNSFKDMYQIIKNKWFNPEYRHIWASGWLLKLKDDFFNAYRPWIAFYGYNPIRKDKEWYELWKKLKPVLTVTSTIIKLQKLKFWEWVWYDHTFKTDKETTIWLIPFGYYEWLNRKLSNNFFVKWQNKYLPIVWNISMNLSCFDAWESDIKLWDEIEIISSDPYTLNNIHRIAEKTETISYEVLINLNEKIKRIII